MGWLKSVKRSTKKAGKKLTATLWPATKTIGRGSHLGISTRKSAVAAARGVKPTKRRLVRR
jgi:hypothetical protein